jgi:uncharacterized protein YutE (UPF0331/DUF86 family)
LTPKSLRTSTGSILREKMTGFRNIAVFNYQALDLDILKSILSNNLKDLEDFSSVLLHYWGYV